MKTTKRSLCIAMVLALTIAFAFVQANVVAAEELKVEDDALVFIEDIVGLDMTKYAVEGFSRNAQTPDNYAGLVREYVSYTLQSAEGKTTVTFTYVNNTLVRWSIDPFGNSPLYIQASPDSPLELAKGFLQRYQTHSKMTLIQEALSVLDAVSEMKTQNVTAGDLKLRITVQGNSTHFTWMRTINGLDFPTGLSIRVKDGVLDTFTDETSFRRISSADVNISQEEAVGIAWERAKTITTLNISLGDTNKIVPFSLKQEPKIVQLQIQNREPFAGCPFWYIQFSAEEIQYGINGVEAGVWADTGELVYAHTVGYQGVISDPENTTTQTGTPVITGTPSPSTQSDNEQTQSKSDTNPSSNAVIIALAASIVAIIVITTAILKRRKK